MWKVLPPSCLRFSTKLDALAMANRRQRIAKRRFSGVSSSSSSSSSTSVTVDVRPVSLSVKKKSIRKPKKGHSSSSSSSSKSKVHPLRVPGSKPGDGCFICKSSSHVAKTCPQKISKDKNKVCFLPICFFLFLFSKVDMDTKVMFFLIPLPFIEDRWIMGKRRF